MSLSRFFEEITNDLKDIVYSMDVGCGIKQEGSNYSYFKFMSDVHRNPDGKYFILVVLTLVSGILL